MDERLGPYMYHRDPVCFPLGRDSLELGTFATVAACCSCCWRTGRLV